MVVRPNNPSAARIFCVLSAADVEQSRDGCAYPRGVPSIILCIIITCYIPVLARSMPKSKCHTMTTRLYIGHLEYYTC